MSTNLNMVKEKIEKRRGRDYPSMMDIAQMEEAESADKLQERQEKSKAAPSKAPEKPRRQSLLELDDSIDEIPLDQPFTFGRSSYRWELNLGDDGNYDLLRDGQIHLHKVPEFLWRKIEDAMLGGWTPTLTAYIDFTGGKGQEPESITIGGAND